MDGGGLSLRLGGELAPWVRFSAAMGGVSPSEYVSAVVAEARERADLDTRNAYVRFLVASQEEVADTDEAYQEEEEDGDADEGDEIAEWAMAEARAYLKRRRWETRDCE